MKNNAMHYLCLADTTKIGLRQAFFDGFRTAMKIATGTKDEELKKLFAHHEDAWIFRLVYEYEEQQEKDLQETIAFAIARCGFDKAGFRAFVFEQDALNDIGVAIKHTNGAPIEDEFFRPLSGQTYRPYRNSKVIKRDDSNITMATADYFALPEPERRQWRYKAWFDIMDHGARLLRVTNNDDVYVSELIRQDILCGDPIINRYVVESGIHPGAYAGDRYENRLYDYRDIIADAIRDLAKEAQLAALHYPPTVISQIKSGHIGSFGQLRLTQIFSMTYESEPKTLRLQVSEFVAMLIELFQFDGTQQTLPIWLTLDDIDSYIDFANKPLRGLQPHRNTEGNTADQYADVPGHLARPEEKCLLLSQCVLSRLGRRITEVLNQDMLTSETTSNFTPPAKITATMASMTEHQSAIDAITKTSSVPTDKVLLNDTNFSTQFHTTVDQFYQLAKLLDMPEDSPFMAKIKKLQGLKIGQAET